MHSAKQKKAAIDIELRRARSDYAAYIATEALFACQKPSEALVNADELAFQTVHQVEELWMKLLCHTLIDIEADLRAGPEAFSVLQRFQRACRIAELMREQLALLDVMSQKAYGEIRAGLGRGSGQDSPGYSALLECAAELWPAFREGWLVEGDETLYEAYRRAEGPAFLLAESMVDFDLAIAAFRHAHLQLVDRMIGLSSRSLKGLPADDLAQGVNRRCFEELWRIRAEAAKDLGSRSAAGPSSM